MFNDIKTKPLLIGLSFFIINLFICCVKFSNLNYNMVENRADLMDDYFGFFILIIFFLLSFSIIAYGISMDNKFSKLGKYVYDFIRKLYQ